MRPRGTRARPRLPFSVVRARLAPFSPRSGRRIAVLVGLALVGTVAETAALVLVAQVAVAIPSENDVVSLGRGVQVATGTASGLALLALVVRLALTVVSAWLTARLSADTVRVGRLVMLDAYFRADTRTQSRERLGELQDYLTSSVGNLNKVNQSFVNALNALISFGVITAAAVLINPVAAVGCAVAAGMLLLLLRPLARRTKEYSWAMSEATRSLAMDVTEAVRVSREVRVFGVRDPVLRRLEVAESRASQPLKMANFTSVIAPAIYQTLALAFLVMAVAAVDRFGGDLESLGAAVILLLRGLSYGQQLQSSAQSLANALPFLDALHERRQLYELNREHSGREALGGVSDIELDGVSLSYDGGDAVVEALSLRFATHESIGVVGPSGSGKSSLLQLLLRLRPPTGGVITVDGVDLWDVRADAWAARVAYVPQEARLLGSTVRDNIRFHRQLSDEQVEAAARLAHVHDDIMSWPLGYDTEVGDSGNQVSGGQRQRIAIARALAGVPDLLLLDEPTSALDLPSEAKLQQTFEGLHGRVGLLIVAHRLSTIVHCDRVLVLKAGRMEGFDRHHRLLESSPFYRDAVRISMIEPMEPSAPDPSTGPPSAASHLAGG